MSTPPTFDPSVNPQTLNNTQPSNLQTTWRSALDPKSNRTYYYDSKTRLTQWTKPLDLLTNRERFVKVKTEWDKKVFFREMEENVRLNLRMKDPSGMKRSGNEVVHPKGFKPYEVSGGVNGRREVGRGRKGVVDDGDSDDGDETKSKSKANVDSLSDLPISSSLSSSLSSSSFPHLMHQTSNGTSKTPPITARVVRTISSMDDLLLEELSRPYNTSSTSKSQPGSQQGYSQDSNSTKSERRRNKDKAESVRLSNTNIGLRYSSNGSLILPSKLESRYNNSYGYSSSGSGSGSYVNCINKGGERGYGAWSYTDGNNDAFLNNTPKANNKQQQQQQLYSTSPIQNRQRQQNQQQNLRTGLQLERSESVDSIGSNDNNDDFINASNIDSSNSMTYPNSMLKTTAVANTNVTNSVSFSKAPIKTTAAATTAAATTAAKQGSVFDKVKTSLSDNFREYFGRGSSSNNIVATAAAALTAAAAVATVATTATAVVGNDANDVKVKATQPMQQTKPVNSSNIAISANKTTDNASTKIRVPQLKHRNSSSTVYVSSTMSTPDKVGMIRVVCAVFREHIVASYRDGLENDDEGDGDDNDDDDGGSGDERKAGIGYENDVIFNDDHGINLPGNRNSANLTIPPPPKATPNPKQQQQENESEEQMLENKTLPSLTLLIHFYTKIFKSSQMEPDCIIMSLIYLERLIKGSGERCVVYNERVKKIYRDEVLTSRKSPQKQPSSSSSSSSSNGGYGNFKQMQPLRLTYKNYRSLIFSCMVLSSKVWDDLSMWNADFSTLPSLQSEVVYPVNPSYSSSFKESSDSFGNNGRKDSLNSNNGYNKQQRPGKNVTPLFPLKRINALELALLDRLNYNVKVLASEYAKYYFLLRSVILRSVLDVERQRKTNFVNVKEEQPSISPSDIYSETFRPLDLEGARRLQNMSVAFGERLLVERNIAVISEDGGDGENSEGGGGRSEGKGTKPPQRRRAVSMNDCQGRNSNNANSATGGGRGKEKGADGKQRNQGSSGRGAGNGRDGENKNGGLGVIDEASVNTLKLL